MPLSKGFWLSESNGDVAAFGSATAFGLAGQLGRDEAVVGIAPHLTGTATGSSTLPAT